MNMKIIIGSLVLLTSSLAFAETESVGIAQLDQVFENYDREGDGLWPAAAKPAVGKMAVAGPVTASAAGANANEGPEKAFDGNVNTKYCTLHPTMWIQHKSADGKRRIEAYGLTTANDFPDRDPRDWTLQGSNDGKLWEVLDERSDETWSARFERRQFAVQKPGDYSWYKLDVTKNQGTHTSQLADFDLLTADEVKEQPVAPAQKSSPVPVAAPAATGWQPLFADDLSNAQFPKGIWTVSNGELTASEDKMIWSKKEYENFVLDLEFKNGPAANSGVIVYVTDPQRWVPNSVEIQIADDHAKKWAKANPTWKCGAIFGRLAADQTMVKPAGEWNRYTIICKGPSIDVILNGTHVTSMDMRKWDSPTHNPDGTEKPKWLSKPLNTHPTKGRIGFQGKHGGAPIWFRNVKIKELD